MYRARSKCDIARLQQRYQNGSIGKNVTSSKPQGNVLITNNAKVFFDASENVIFDTSFECALGATFEVR